MTTIPTPTAPAPTTPGDAVAAIDADQVARYQAAFEASSSCRLAQNAVTQTAATDVALDRSIVTRLDHTFSHVLDDWDVTNQKKSGRCWMFAALDLLRVGAMRKMNLKKFEFSQNYTLFWDKFERSNYFLEAIIDTADRPVDDRTIAFLLERPLDDGGQWDMFVNVVKKHGLVPQPVMPETQSSSNTPVMNQVLLHTLRQGARTLRDLRSAGAPMEAARAAKDEVLQAVHRILCIHLGTPPTRFEWQWNDEDRKFHRDGEMTPLDFAAKYVDIPFDEYVCLVHDPRRTSPMGRTFTVEHLGNVVEGSIVLYLNVEIELMKDLAARSIVGGEPVWFGCDVGKMMQRKQGLWDRKLYDWSSLYETTFDLDKAGRLEHHQTCMTHAMLFTGVDLVGDRPRRWRVENSWGEENGRKGFFVMNDSWFDEYMFEVAVRRDALPPELQAALLEEPIVLPPWDPMGALA